MIGHSTERRPKEDGYQLDTAWVSKERQDNINESLHTSIDSLGSRKSNASQTKQESNGQTP